MSKKFVTWLDEVGMSDMDSVGGKNASLGEMIGALSEKGVRVPGGFATTTFAFESFLDYNNLRQKIKEILVDLDSNNTQQLEQVGGQIRAWVYEGKIPEDMQEAIAQHYRKLTDSLGDKTTFAVRSSATAEDLPDASFAGQQETYLNVSGLDDILDSIKKTFASLYNNRAISYRVHQGFEHEAVLLSAGIQQMIRSDIAASGVMFSLDTESGFDDAVFITSSYGLGETVVQGEVNPDEFYVYKPSLKAGKQSILSRNIGSKEIKMVYNQGGDNPVKIVDVDEDLQRNFSLNDAQVEELAKYAIIIEAHYGRPMDIEWALDGNDGKLYIVQARPETVKSQEKASQGIERFQLSQSGGRQSLIEGRAIGQKIGSGNACIIQKIDQMHHFSAGDVLVADITNPDWEPIMKKASAIVTNRGGRTCHAAIVARELGVPAVVGTGNATEVLSNGDPVTVSCAEGDTGVIYAGLLDFECQKISVDTLPEIPTKIMMNVARPDQAFNFARIPNAGVGLARLEFIINNAIGIHPKALLEFDQLPPSMREVISNRISGYKNPVDFYVKKLIEGISRIGAAFADSAVIIRLSDFKSNEYANLYAGERYEPDEENPMIGFRGASRYVADEFRDCFDLECQALKTVRDEMGLTNVEIMVPFVRTLEEAARVVEILAQNGLKRGENGLRLIMMCELPSNAVLADEFLQYFDGFSIGSNDMTQLTLGLDRDSFKVADGFDERNPAVKKMLAMAIEACHRQGKYVGICGQGPSDYPDFAKWLFEQNISSISLNPDSVIETWMSLG